MTRKKTFNAMSINYNVSEAVIFRAYELINNGFSRIEINETIRGQEEISASLYAKLTNYIIMESQIKNQSLLKNFRPIKKQYYANEDEMIIKDYRIEDLTGEEKLILENL